MTGPDSSQKIRMNRSGLARQSGPVAILKATQFAGVALAGILIPRWMGPALFGQFAVMFSLITLWRTACNIGGRYIFGRFIPKYASQGESGQIRAVFMHVLGTRVLIASIGAPLLFLALRRLLPGASLAALVAATCTYIAALIAGPLFGVQFGLNRLGLSMINDPMRRFLLLALIVLIGGTQSLERASYSLLLAQLLVLLVGLAAARQLFTLEKSVWDLSRIWEHLRFGIAMYAASLLVRVPWHLGESSLALLEVESADIAYFSVAVAAAGAYARLLVSVTTLLVPSLSLREAEEDSRGRDETLGIALRYLLVAAGLFVLVVIACAPAAIRLLLGEDFLGVVPNLLLISIGTVALPLRSSALAMGVARGRVWQNLQLGLVAVVVFGLVALALIPEFSSKGASAAVGISILCSGLTGAFQLRRTGVPREARLGRLVLASSVAALVVGVGGMNSVVAAIAAVVYLVLLSTLGVVRWTELRAFVSEGGMFLRARPVA